MHHHSCIKRHSFSKYWMIPMKPTENTEHHGFTKSQSIESNQIKSINENCRIGFIVSVTSDIETCNISHALPLYSFQSNKIIGIVENLNVIIFIFIKFNMFLSSYHFCIYMLAFRAKREYL